MAKPGSRNELIEYALRALGKPVIRINVSNEQIDDRVDEALQYWQEFHGDASEEIYIAHQITAEDLTNEYFSIDNDILWVDSMFPAGSSTSTGMFDLRYQIKLNDPFTYRAEGGIAGYYITKRHINLIEHLLGGENKIRFSRYRNRIQVDGTWSEIFTEGDYVMFHGWRIIDPEEVPAAWNDLLLKELVVALIKRQWRCRPRRTTWIRPSGTK